MAANHEQLRAALKAAGQEHVLQYVDAGLTTPEETEALYKQVATLDLPALNQIFAELNLHHPPPAAAPAVGAPTGTGTDTHTHTKEPAAIAEYTPISDVASVSSSSPTQLKAWEEAGLQAIAAGKIAALVLSGGQGTRLGFSGPKGMYDIGLPSHKSIFQLVAERVLRVSALAAAAAAPTGKDTETYTQTHKHMPLYIMTSPLNHETTKAFFESHAYFGLDSNSVIFFPQGTMPCFSLEGKLLLESPSHIAEAPDGNGGIYPSLAKTGTLKDMQERGVEAFHVFSVDNVLVKVADPVFVGYCLTLGADCGNKVVWKAHAHEKVGVVLNKNGKPAVLEYSEMEEQMKTQTQLLPDTHTHTHTKPTKEKLVFGAGNICSHFFTLPFLTTKILPHLSNLYHAATKKIPSCTYPHTHTHTPQHENGIKLEAFIFDVFPFSEKMALWEVEREDEFAPVKDAPGGKGDTPEKARWMLSEEAKRWVRAAGGLLVGGGGGGGEGGEEEEEISEISPLVSYKGEGLEGRVEGKEVRLPVRFL